MATICHIFDIGVNFEKTKMRYDIHVKIERRKEV